MKKTIIFHIVTLISTSLFLSLNLFDPLVIREHLETKTFDLRLYLRNVIKKPTPYNGIAIVAVDEKSIKEIGRWPWKRDIMAGLVNKISEGRPKVIGIDIMFSERESKETDGKLLAAIKAAKNAVLAMAFDVPTGNKGKNVAPKDIPDFLWDSAFMVVKGEKEIPWREWAVKPDDVIPPIEEFSKASTLGHVYTHPDRDAVLRWEILYLQYGDDFYPSLSLQVARIALGIDAKDLILYGGSGIGLGDRVISTDLSGRVLINYVGKEKSYRYIPAADLINGIVSPSIFKDRIVLLGTSAIATYDQKVTPFSSNMPGVEKNANVIENMVHNNFLRQSPGVIELIAILLTGILIGFFIPRLKAVQGAVMASGLIISYIILACYLFIYHNLWINLLYPVSNMFSIFTIQTVMKFFYEEKKAKEIRQMFSSYVSPKIVKELIDNPDKTKLGGERRVVTVLFSDIVGFTSLSERRQPEEVVSMLNEYFKEMADIIFKWDGTLDKFIGDEIMAFWGAPVEQPGHAELAVRCALNMSDRLNELQEMWRSRGGEVLDCGIGINTGEVLIGNIGAQGKKMDYTAIGDHVNLASRVEKLTRQYGARILVAESTVTSIESLIEKGAIGHFELRDLAFVKVKGKEKEIKIFELKGLKQREKTA